MTGATAGAKMLTVASKALIAVGIASAMISAAEAMGVFGKKAGDLNEQMERFNKLTGRGADAKVFAVKQAKTIDQAKEERRRIVRDLNVQMNLRRRFAKEAAALEGTASAKAGRFFDSIPFVGQFSSKQVEAQGKRADERGAERQIAALRGALKKADDEIKRMQTFVGPTIPGDIHEKRLAGEKNPAIAAFEALQKGQGTKAVDKMIDALDTEARMLKMGAEQAFLFQLAMKGATDEQLRSAKATFQLKKENQEYMKAQAEGQALIEKFKSPQDKFAERQDRLNQLLKQGDIDQRTFNLALEDAKKSLLGQGATARRTGLQPRDAARFGSLEAQNRLREFTEIVAKDPNKKSSSERLAQESKRTADGIQRLVSIEEDKQEERDSSDVEKLLIAGFN
jgi:hypothetical protein